MTTAGRDHDDHPRPRRRRPTAPRAAPDAHAGGLSLLLFAAVVYLVTLGQDGFLGFVNAGAEASMVGAIADWFAVTALFKHPLGLPIPHTALIPKRKDELGRSLEEFVGENFLQEDDHPRPGRVGDDLAARRRVARRARARTPGRRRGLRRRRRSAWARCATSTSPTWSPRRWCRGSARSRSAPLAGGAAGRGGPRRPAPRRRRPGPRRAARLAAASTRTPFAEVLERAGAVVGAAPAQRRGDPPGAPPSWSPGSPRSAPTRTTMPARRSTRCSRRLADDLQHDPETQERTERLKDAAARPPAGRCSPASRCGTRCAAPCRRRCRPRRRGARSPGARADGVRRPAARRCGAARGVSTAPPRTSSVFAVERYGAELTAVITHTIERWDGSEAARRIELHVGRDLQFIRINGTIVGGLVGVLIHAVTVVCDGRSSERDWCVIRARRVDPARPVPQAGRPGRHRRRREGPDRQGLVRVNGDVETRRGRQLVSGDVVECAGRRAVVSMRSTGGLTSRGPREVASGSAAAAAAAGRALTVADRTGSRGSRRPCCSPPFRRRTRWCRGPGRGRSPAAMPANIARIWSRSCLEPGDLGVDLSQAPRQVLLGRLAAGSHRCHAPRAGRGRRPGSVPVAARHG